MNFKSVNPPFNRPYDGHIGKGELREYHREHGHMASFFDQYFEDKPVCVRGLGWACDCPACTKMRGRMLDRER